MKANRYVALLRGINVGKNKRVSMSDLRALVESLDYRDVRTLLNSGNVVFSSPRADTTTSAALKIEKAIEAKLGLTSRVTVLSAAELAKIVDANPLVKNCTDPARLFVAVINDSKHRAKLEPFIKQKWGADLLQVGERVAYLWCPDGMIDSDLANAVGKALGDGVTTRNWATILKIHQLLNSGGQ